MKFLLVLLLAAVLLVAGHVSARGLPEHDWEDAEMVRNLQRQIARANSLIEMADTNAVVHEEAPAATHGEAPTAAHGEAPTTAHGEAATTAHGEAATTAHGEPDHEATGHGEMGEHGSSGEHPAGLGEHEGDEGHGEGHGDPLEHVIHIIHEAHLGLEFLEKLEHTAHHSWAPKIQAAKQSWLSQVGKLHVTFKGYAEAWKTSETAIATRKTMEQLKDRLAKGKIRGAANVRRSREALKAMTDQMAANSGKIKAAQAYLTKYVQAIRKLRTSWFSSMKGALSHAKSGVKLAGPLVARVTTGLRTFTTGSGRVIASASRGIVGISGSSLKFLINPKFIRGVMFVGAALEGINGFQHSKASTTAGRIFNGVLHGGVGFLVMKNPYVALIDLCLPESLKLSTMLKGGADMIVGIVELAFTGNDAMLRKVNEANLNGDNGYILNLAAALGTGMAGDWAEIEKLNERNLSGKNGAVLHYAAGVGELVFNGNFKPLEEYQAMALRGDHGVIAKTLAETGEYWAEHGIAGGVLNALDEFRKQAERDVPIPKRKGVYIKIIDCKGLRIGHNQRYADRPYWKCSTTGHDAHQTNVAKNPQSGGRFSWDPNAKKPGFGLDFPGKKFSVTCTLKENYRLWSDASRPVWLFFSESKFESSPTVFHNVQASCGGGKNCGSCRAVYMIK